MTELMLRGTRLRDGRVVDVRVAEGRVVDVNAEGMSASNTERVVDAEGALLLPGLVDHHLHLAATAAAMDSVHCGPPAVTTRRDFEAVLQEAAAVGEPGTWIRAVGHHVSLGGDLDRDSLDELIPYRPVRVQHRSGALWTVNSAGLAALGAEHGDVPDGIERDAAGRLTGRVWREDAWLRERLGPRPPLDLARLGRQLAARGVTTVTDATPDLDDSSLSALLSAVAQGAVPQRLHLLGIDTLPADLPPEVRARVSVGPRKLVVPDHNLPTLPALVDELRRARRSRTDGRRPVAVHCVSRVALALLSAALDETGSVPGDRIEHASVVPNDLLPTLRRLRLTVVTQPGLVAERGDDYLQDADDDDRDNLYRHASLLEAGIPVGLSTDAPYTAPDPWRAIDAASHRRTLTGTVVGPQERVNRDTAIDGFTSAATDPGGAPQHIRPGLRADLCLVDEGTRTPTSAVRLTTIGGRVVHEASR